MLRKRCEIVVLSLLLCMMVTTAPVFADYSKSNSGSLGGYAIDVTSRITTNKRNSSVTSSCNGVSAITSKNTSYYGSGTTMYVTEVGYGPGSATAYVNVGSGYAIYKCVGEGHYSISGVGNTTLYATVTA